MKSCIFVLKKYYLTMTTRKTFKKCFKISFQKVIWLKLVFKKTRLRSQNLAFLAFKTDIKSLKIPLKMQFSHRICMFCKTKITHAAYFIYFLKTISSKTISVLVHPMLVYEFCVFQNWNLLVTLLSSTIFT